MKKLQKSFLATAVAAVMAPSAFAIEAELPEVHGSLDVTAGYKMAEESALAVDSAPGDSSWIGLSGEISLDNGSAVTYLHNEGLTLDDGAGFTGSYESYLGYRTDSFEVRAGNLFLPTRTVMDKADVFSGSYADANNVLLLNTTASNAVKFVGGDETLAWAASIDMASNTDLDPNAIPGSTNAAEDANNPNAMDGVRLSGMVDYRADSFSVAGGMDFTDAYTSIGVSADFALGDNAGLVAGIEMHDFDAADISPMTFVVGGFMGMGEKGKFKGQLGYIDFDSNVVGDADDDTGIILSAGYDHALAETVTGYFLFAMGLEGGMAGSGITNSYSAAGIGGAVEHDEDGDNMVLATGLKVAF